MKAIPCKVVVIFENSFQYPRRYYDVHSIRSAIALAKIALESRYSASVRAVHIMRVDTCQVIWSHRNP